ncbi:hypothetical protein AO385_0717 [Moraxella catarrhalis]|uniref:Uncharacterized protein n=1 Tax=Moraxella catarrhalis TaxID=480 RepID=A0A198XMN2_MORCA|nr:hypothetical protein AO384_1230 [Moraxella catarrhalis]OAU97375.1 hypothetical protein AO383_0935 [Moraxella catarrhalis]OAV03007.1 hypothetical protein AO385_0717 [Moraxella catarrhalis]OAV04828.1 hypothetical protein AO381_0545 [Moraxella catarrhalis]OAV10343.1 hypothetical protein AO380_0760 [Moraxella catarrhalis]
MALVYNHDKHDNFKALLRQGKYATFHQKKYFGSDFSGGYDHDHSWLC